MKHDQYKELRNELVASAEELINAGDFEASTLKMDEVKELDNKFENIQRELANLNSLKEQESVQLENKSADAELINATKIETGVSQNMDNKVILENAFAKSVLGKELSAVEMENVTYAEDNQVVIPEVTMNEIIGLVGEAYPFFGDARKYQIKGNVTLPKHKAIVSGDAAFYAEKKETAVEDNDIVKVTLGAKEVAKLIEVSFKVEAMSIEAFMTYLKQELVDRIGALVGTAVFTGDATKADPEFEGLIKVLDTAGQKVEYASATGLTYENITSAFAKVASQFSGKTAIYVNNATLWTGLANIVDGNGRPLFIADPSGATVGRLFGRPVKVDGGLTDGVIVIGDANAGYAINTNKGLTIESDRNLKARTTEFLAHAIMDGAVTNEQALVVLIPQP